MPAVDPGGEFYWSAFWALHSDRPIGMSEGAIPFSAIDRYALRYGITEVDEFDRLLDVLAAMDGEYLARRSEHAERAKELNAALQDAEKRAKGPKTLA